MTKTTDAYAFIGNSFRITLWLKARWPFLSLLGGI
jgi:hypothetical protein